MIDDTERVKARAESLSPEELEAAAILEESDARETNRVDPPGQSVEHRRSEDTVELPTVDEDQAPKP